MLCVSLHIFYAFITCLTCSYFFQYFLAICFACRFFQIVANLQNISQCIYQKTSMLKWPHTVQPRVVQGSTIVYCIPEVFKSVDVKCLHQKIVTCYGRGWVCWLIGLWSSFHSIDIDENITSFQCIWFSFGRNLNKSLFTMGQRKEAARWQWECRLVLRLRGTDHVQSLWGSVLEPGSLHGCDLHRRMDHS